uniref:Venom peptide n=1 Tax=Heterorhabditis bacteriophora TaxID=37862 RepID=A0A1I7XI93_HETBA
MNLICFLALLLSIIAVAFSALSIDGEDLILSINDEGPIKVRKVRDVDDVKQ